MYGTYAHARAAYLRALRAKFPHRVGDVLELRTAYAGEERVTALRIEALEPMTAGWISVRGHIKSQRGEWGKTQSYYQMPIHYRPMRPYAALESSPDGINPRSNRQYPSQD